MTVAQTAMYFSLWGRVRDYYRARGIDPKQCDAKRHELHKKALGADKSSKDFTNVDLDKFKAACLAIVEPDNLDAQLRQLDQPEKRFSALLAQARDLAAKCVNKPGREGGYLDGMARKIFGPAQYQMLDEKQLGQLCGILNQRIAQIQRKSATTFKQPVGEHAAAANKQDDDNPF